MSHRTPSPVVAIAIERDGDRERVTFTGQDRLVVLAEALALWAQQRPWPLCSVPPDVHSHGELWMSSFTRWSVEDRLAEEV